MIKKKSWSSDPPPPDDELNNLPWQCTRIEPSFSCYNVIAINNLPLLHRSEASLHLSCGQMLRRDQVTAHADTVHNRIMAGSREIRLCLTTYFKDNKVQRYIKC
jgi:hypothetical protein